MERRRGLGPVSVVLLAVLAGCTLPSEQESSGQESSSEPTPSPTDGEAATAASAPMPEACEPLPKGVLQWAKLALAPHPGPIRSSTMVRATTTDTGIWYVVGVDREYVLDDGTPAGDGSRNLGLTNAIDKPRSQAKMISIGEGPMAGDPIVSWKRTNWRGETLAAGRQAAQQAVECLDAAAE